MHIFIKIRNGLEIFISGLEMLVSNSRERTSGLA